MNGELENLRCTVTREKGVLVALLYVLLFVTNEQQ
jgi:hypothetical protein